MRKIFSSLLSILILLVLSNNLSFSKGISSGPSQTSNTGYSSSSDSVNTSSRGIRSSCFSSPLLNNSGRNFNNYPSNGYSYYGDPYDYYGYHCSDWGRNIHGKIIGNWKFPENTNYRATVKFVIDPNGRASLINFQRSSGNSQFDQSIIQAIKDSEPFEAAASRCFYDSIVLEFYR